MKFIQKWLGPDAAAHKELRDFFLVSKIDLGRVLEFQSMDSHTQVAPVYVSAVIKGMKVRVTRTDEWLKCERCWIRCSDVGTDKEYPGTCGRCSRVLSERRAEA